MIAAHTLQAVAQTVMDEDAHGAARTASARRRSGATTPLFIREEDLPAIRALLSAHGVITDDIVLPGTLE
jgi:hypothetical protein